MPVSCEQTDVEIATESRTYRKEVPLEEGIECPGGHLHGHQRLSPYSTSSGPWCKASLPFATPRGSDYKAQSAMYWLMQFFRKQRGLEPDWKMGELVPIYEEIITVNGSFRVRIADVLRRMRV